MDAWELADLEAARVGSGKLYHEFFSVPDLSGGLYVLEAGATDPQSPHAEDELYVVMSGKAKVVVDGEVRPIVEGSVVFVGRACRAPVRRHRGTARPAGRLRPRRIFARRVLISA